jgi:hypothetical protein
MSVTEVEASGLVCTTCNQVTRPGGECGCPAYVPAEAKAYGTASAELEWVMRRIGEPCNNFAVTRERRKLIELCVAIADEHGHEVRHGGR